MNIHLTSITLLLCLNASVLAGESASAVRKRDKPIAGWAEDVFFNSAIDFIRGSKKAGKPFFIYLCTYSPHHPITLPNPSWADDYKKKVNGGTAFFFAAIEKIDAQIGRVRATLTEECLDRDTILIFMTDNDREWQQAEDGRLECLQ